MKDCFDSVDNLDVDILVKYMLIHHVVLQQLTTVDIEKPVISVTQKTIKNGFLGEKNMLLLYVIHLHNNERTSYLP